VSAPKGTGGMGGSGVLGGGGMGLIGGRGGENNNYQLHERYGDAE
jgi:hypothetical protein